MSDIQINGVSIGIRMVSWAPFERAINYAGIAMSDTAEAVTGFTEAVIHASWQWKVSHAMDDVIYNYRMMAAGNPAWSHFNPRDAGRCILRQRRLDRRYKFPSFFALDRMGK